MGVKRFGNMPGNAEEFEIASLVGLHNLPNPHLKQAREHKDSKLGGAWSAEIDSPGLRNATEHVYWLKEIFETKGYNVLFPIGVHPTEYDFGDGLKKVGLIMSGHHRAVAMALLGEKTIPARLTRMLPANILDADSAYVDFSDIILKHALPVQQKDCTIDCTVQ